MEEIFGYIDHILFAEEENGFTVAKLKEPKKPELTPIIGILPNVQVGETIRCQGHWKVHPKFGQQFEVTSFTAQAPTDLLGIQRYLESGMIKGIGAAYAERIVQKFGLDTLEVIDKKPQKLLSVKGIGEKRVARIIQCWEEQKQIREVMIFLRGHGVTPAFAHKIYRTYQEQSIVKMQENPYRIAQDIRGIGFKSADKIAQDLGMAKEAPQRLQSGIQHVLWELSNEGHVCYPQEELAQAASEILEVSKELVVPHIEMLRQQDVLVIEESKVWIKPLFLSEVGIAKDLNRLLSSPCSLRQVDTPKALEWVEAQLRLQLADQQKEGVRQALQEKVFILTGGPGTGKSTITNAILRIYEKLTKKIYLAAPTGRAAKRMSEITHRKAFTLHSLLEMDFIAGKFKKGKDNPLSCDLIIVDEASMIDTQLMHSLLKALPSTAKVIFVGDIDQLPSVGPGTVLRDMIASERICLVRLDEIFRQAKGSAIITNAHRINRGEFPFLEGTKDFRFIDAQTPEEIATALITLITKQLKQHDPFRTIQVLCPMKRGIIGTENLNQLLQEALNPSTTPLIRMGHRFHLGDKVMQLRNNYDKEVFNGDVGLIEKIDLDDQELRVLFDGKSVSYDFTELDELVLAYAVSIHKYQGSECPCVIIPIHTTHFKLLHRNLLYTGVTRGKKMVILVGTKKAVAIAVQTEEIDKRHTGLKNQIQSFCKAWVTV